MKRYFDIYKPEYYELPIGIETRTGKVLMTDLHEPEPRTINLKDNLSVLLMKCGEVGKSKK